MVQQRCAREAEGGQSLAEVVEQIQEGAVRQSQVAQGYRGWEVSGRRGPEEAEARHLGAEADHRQEEVAQEGPRCRREAAEAQSATTKGVTAKRRPRFPTEAEAERQSF